MKKAAKSARAIAACVRKFTRSSESFRMLDSATATSGGTWAAGGCGVLADALEGLVPGAEKVAIKDAGTVQHVLIRAGGRYLDADGLSSKSELLRRWRTTELLRNPKVVPYVEKERGEIPRSAKLTARLRRILLKKCF